MAGPSAPHSPRDTEERALGRLAPDVYGVVRILNRHVPESSTVLAIAWVMEAYTPAHIRTHHLSAANERLTGTLWTPLTPDLQPLRRFSFSFPRRNLRAIRIVQTRDAAAVSVARRKPGFILNRPRIQPDQWGIAELNLFDGGNELPRSSSWSAVSVPNPWDAALALDGNPLTAWKTWQPAEPGMFFEVEFDRERSLDGVSFDSPLAQSGLAFVLSGQDGAGRPPSPSSRKALAAAASGR